ncbi:MAG TPA: hypothetical protein VMM76_06400 [Pirellulaceae bacterium]|nr:hypothetical protein [Pirellulaceae bacterium]
MQPLYTPENCQPAYQLNWSVSVFAKAEVPAQAVWLEALRAATEADGVRILECRAPSATVMQFFVSTLPRSSPSDIVRSIKGRWQYILRDQQPSAFRRNYRIDSVGSANSELLDQYISGQNEKHPMADPRLQERLCSLQFHDPAIDLSAVQTGNYGQFVHSLQIVIENTHGWHEVRQDVLAASRDMIVRAAAQKNWRLSRIGLLSNHIHILLGAGMTESPESIALSLLNNLAWVQEMRPVFRFSYYVGTFGGYDHSAIRRNLEL